jgi:hypothetical protein
LGAAIVTPVWDNEFASPTFDQCLLADDKRDLNQRLARVTARLYGQVAPWLVAAGTLRSLRYCCADRWCGQAIHYMVFMFMPVTNLLRVVFQGVFDHSSSSVYRFTWWRGVGEY